jgi:hypothetical protein
MFLPFKRGKQISPFIDPLIITPFIVKMMLSMMQNALAGEIHLQRKILVYCLGTPTAAAMRQIVEETEEKRRNAPEYLLDHITAWRDSPILVSPKNFEHEFRRAKAYTFDSYVVERELIVARRWFMTENAPQRVAAIQDLMDAKQVKLDKLIARLTVKEKHGTPSGVCMRRYLDRLREHGFTMLDSQTFWSKKTYDCVLRDARDNPLNINTCPSIVLLDLTEAIKVHKANRGKF